MAEPISECPICYDSISTTNSATTSCGHRFHTTCLLQAAAIKSSCPYCRTELNPAPAPEPQMIWDDDEVQDFLPPDDPIDSDLNEFLVQHFNRHFQPPPAAPAHEPIQVRAVIVPLQYEHRILSRSRNPSPDRTRSRSGAQPRNPTIRRCGICRQQGHNSRSCPAFAQVIPSIHMH